MSYLCIKKQEPTAGAKGIMCGGVFLPIESYESGSPTPASQIPSEGLALYVPLSEAPNASEWAGYGAITYKTVDGVPCAYFNGDNSNGLYMGDKAFETQTFTVSIVFNTKSFSPTSGYMPYLVNFGTSSSDNSRLALRLDNYYSNNRNALAMVYNGVYLSVQNLSADTWYSAQMKFDGTQISLYLNGELQSQLNVSAMEIQSGVWIGKSPSNDGAFNGYLSSMRVYNRALSDAEIALLAREFVFNSAPLAGRKGLLVPVGESVAAPPANGLVFYAPLSEESSTAETGQALTKTGTVTYQTVEGLPCARFDATNSYLSATVPNMAGVLTGTISLWIYVSNDAGKYSTDYPRFFTFGDKSKPNNGFICGTWAKPEGVINYQSNNSSNGWPSANNPLRKGRWINFVATITESGFLQSYVNGSEGSFCETGAITINEPSVYINYINGDYGIDGIYIADVRMYNRILSASEIQSLAFEHNPTKSLFIPLQTAYGTPQVGQKGIIVRSSQVVGHAIYSKSAETMPTDGLVFYLPCDSDSYTTAQTGQTLSKSGTVTATTVNGIPCLEIKSGSYLNGTLNGFSGDVSMALSFWFKRLDSNSSAYVTAGKGNYNLTNGNEIWGSVESDHIETACGSAGSDARRAGIYNAAIGTGWHHGYFSYDATSKKFKTVLDGNTENAGYSAERSYNFSSGLTLCINSLARATSAVKGNANYSQIRIFNRALTDAEIKTLAGEYKQKEIKKMFIAVKEQSAIPEDGLIFYAPLQEDKSTAETGQALTKNGTITYQTYKGIPCAHFSSAYISSQLSDYVTPYPMTFAIWAAPDTTDSRALWSFSNDKPLMYWNGSYHVYEPDHNVSAANVGDWHHIAWSINSDRSSTYYFDGVAMGTVTSSNTSAIKSMCIGYRNGNQPQWIGYLAGFRIYNRALSEDEISAIAGEYTADA